MSAVIMELDEPAEEAADIISVMPELTDERNKASRGRTGGKSPTPPAPPPDPPGEGGSGGSTPPQTESKNKSSRSKSPKTPRTPGRGSKGSSSKSKSRKGSTRSRSGKKKGITFKRTVGVHSIPNLSTYSIAEKQLAWFAPDEYGEMEDECDLTAEILDRKKPLWPGQCSRGLEAWTVEGEQRKEGHVQLAIDIVWQAQLDQWKASSDIHACWEFIRERYLAVSTPCHALASERGMDDEKAVKGYLAGVRSVEKNRLKLLGISHKDRKLRRHGGGEDPSVAATPKSARKKIGRASSDRSITMGKSPPNRNHSEKAPKKGVLKVSLSEDDMSRASARRTKVSSGASVASSLLDDVSTTSSKRSTASKKKISYQPKSRSKVPVSPVASLVGDNSDDDSTSRRLRSHMSVTSEDSTRRRMLRTTTFKPL